MGLVRASAVRRVCAFLAVLGLVAVVTLGTFPTSARGTPVSGPLEGVWDMAGSPYTVEGDVFVVASGLTIDPGVQVLFDGPYAIYAQAPLRGDFVTFARSSAVTCQFTFCGALHLGPTSGASWVRDSTFVGMAAAIIVEGVSPVLERNLISDGNVGMFINASAVTVDSHILQSVAVAYAINDFATPLIENGTVQGTFLQDFVVDGDSHPATLNATFTGLVSILDVASDLTVRNYLDILVRDQGAAPLPGADVETWEDGVPIYNSTTGDAQTGVDGRVRWIDTRDRVFQQASVVDVRNEARVTYSGLTFNNNPRVVDMFDSHEELFQAMGGGDVTPPRVLVTNPADGGTAVPVSIALGVTFDEDMNKVMTEGAFSYTDGVTTFDETDGSFLWPTPFRFAFDPDADLAYCTAYTATLAASATDLAGNPLDGDGDGTGGDPHTWSFTTEDGPPVQVLLTDPLDGAGGVLGSTPLVLTFSRPVDRGSVEAAFAYADGTTWWNQDDGIFQWDAASTEATFLPAANLAFNTLYTVWLNATAEDLCGNTLDGNGNGNPQGSPMDDYSWSFTTEAGDVTPPRVTVVSPADGALLVPVPTTIVATFDENMNTSATEDSVLVTGGPSPLGAADGVVTWDLGSRRMTLVLSLAYGTLHTVTLDGGQTRDLAGNTLDGNENGAAEGSPADDYAWSFTTAPAPDNTPPEILATDPGPDETNVDVGATVGVTFSEAMDKLTAEAAFRLRAPNGTVGGTFTWVGDTVMVFTPDADLVHLTTYTAEVGVGARDLAGNPLTAESIWSFTTEPWTGTVTGTVVKEDGTPLAGVRVTLVELDRTATTNAEGVYRMTGVPAGTYNITFAKAGFETERSTVTLEVGQAEVQKGATMRAAGGLADLWWVFLLFIIVFILALLLMSQRKRGQEPEMHLEEMEREVAVVEPPTRESPRPPEGDQE